MVLKIIFWVSLFIIFYSYAGYGILLFFLVRIKRLLKKSNDIEIDDSFQPEITLVVAAYNEEWFIRKKIENTLQLSYPKNKLKIIFITDGSNDRTPEIVAKFSEIQLLHLPERKGKIAAMNRAMQFVETPFVIFSDANTLLNPNCVEKIARHYVNPKVGGVAGEKKIITFSDSKAAGAGEGLYWKYESYLKKLDSDFYTVVGAAGELFSVRKDLFELSAENIIIEDFVQSLKICKKGFVIKYEPDSYAMEEASPSMKEEEKRKIRICAGAFQAMILLKDLFNIFRYPALSFQFISHRILRWTLCPISLITILLTNIAIMLSSGSSAYKFFLSAQLLFYLGAVIGKLFANKNIKVKIFYLPYYFSFMNISVFLGFRKFIMKKQTVLWDKVVRPLQQNAQIGK